MADCTEDLMTEITDTIMVFDRQGDNKLAVRDIVSALRALGMNPGSNDWDDCMLNYEKKGVYRIDIKEFASIYDQESKKTKTTFSDLVEGLKCIDPVGAKGGMVNAATLMRYMSVMGDTVTEEQAETIISSALDVKGKNVIIDDIVKLVMGDNK